MSKHIAKFHYLTQDLKESSHQELVSLACESGIKWIQLRMKIGTADERGETARECMAIASQYHNVRVIINDDVQLAKNVGAAGVHLGKSDMEPAKAREILGSNFIIGGTANTFGDILNLSESSVDYIGLGPFRFTSTKQNLSPVIGLSGYEQMIEKCAMEKIQIPIIGIGGIGASDVSDLLATGLHGIAVSSAVNLAHNFSATTKSFLSIIKDHNSVANY